MDGISMNAKTGCAALLLLLPWKQAGSQKINHEALCGAPIVCDWWGSSHLIQNKTKHNVIIYDCC